MLRIISGKFGSRQIKSLDSFETRPTKDQVKEALFSKIGPYFEKESFLDLFAGSGAVGIEAYSRGCNKVVLVDNNPKAISIIKENANNLKIEDGLDIYHGSYKTVLSTLNQQFDYIYIDPPYALDLAYDESIDLIIKNNLLKDNGYLIVESLKEKQLKDQYNNLLKIKDATYGISKLTYYRKK